MEKVMTELISFLVDYECGYENPHLVRIKLGPENVIDISARLNNKKSKSVLQYTFRFNEIQDFIQCFQLKGVHDLGKLLKKISMGCIIVGGDCCIAISEKNMLACFMVLNHRAACY